MNSSVALLIDYICLYIYIYNETKAVCLGFVNNDKLNEVQSSLIDNIEQTGIRIILLLLLSSFSNVQHNSLYYQYYSKY